MGRGFDTWSPWKLPNDQAHRQLSRALRVSLETGFPPAHLLPLAVSPPSRGLSAIPGAVREEAPKPRRMWKNVWVPSLRGIADVPRPKSGTRVAQAKPAKVLAGFSSASRRVMARGVSRRPGVVRLSARRQRWHSVRQ